MERLLEKIPSLLKKRTYIIYTDGKPYLQRVYLKHKGIFPEILLHKFLASDNDRDLHDHPWKWAVSFILFGEYKQEYRENINSAIRFKTFKAGNFNFLKWHTWHKVTLLTDKVWTLFIAGKRQQAWGFLKTENVDGVKMPVEKIPWPEYLIKNNNYVLDYWGNKTQLPQ